MLIRLAAILALLCSAMTPSFAQSAPFAPFPQSASPRNGALAGAYLRVSLDRHGHHHVRPQAGLRIAASQDFRDSITGQGSVTQRDVFDLRMTGMPRLTVLLAGTPVTGRQAPRANAIGSGGAIAIGGGVLVLLLLAAVASGGAGFGDTCPVINGDRSHCL